MSGQAIIALGSNLGDRLRHFSNALMALNSAETQVISTSSIYETEPVGVVGQSLFLNAACAVNTILTPEELLERLLSIELANGRVRTTPNGPRTLDLDLLFFENEIRTTTQLILPHPRYLERDFVCIPLSELLSIVPLIENPQWDELRKTLGHRDTSKGNPIFACRFHAKFA
ncbi:MAG: 2-amino-4-hydroxy-6-hydroxymethyldihydropteridine diphosphokinase [Puniceicoccales bacterium]|jgi:2-amino-4-hydroxy-6-hydroxymethyldihydropteridine diphosphokinase|nr:2-amino-4-hydroxy-6-hydroxymethyldihydropteridine diphosphokinase [Puniceicoccales bacterium]